MFPAIGRATDHEEFDMHLTKESRARLREDRDLFDREARKNFCLRCSSHKSVHRVDTFFRMDAAVLDHSTWLCDSCGKELIQYINTFVSEIRAARLDAERPAWEADLAAKRANLAESLEQSRAKLDADRAAKGQPPLPLKRAAKRTAKRTAKPSGSTDRMEGSQ